MPKKLQALLEEAEISPDGRILFFPRCLKKEELRLLNEHLAREFGILLLHPRQADPDPSDG